jgi:hypothetical protein
MNPTKLILLLALAAALAAVPAFAGSTPDAPAGGKITVTGNGVVLSTPDVAAWSFGVSVQSDSAAKALSGANATMKKIVDAVRAAGVAAADIRTEYVSISPQIDNQGRQTDRFVASSSVGVVVRNAAHAGRIVDAAVDAGANAVGGPSFSASDQAKLYDQALRAAIADARTHAQALAEASNVVLGRMIEVQEGGGSQPVPMAEAAKAGADSGTQIEPGSSSTYATVTVIWSTT